MRIAVGIMTYNAESSLRFDLLERTVDSILAAFADDALIILDNGSSDGSTDTICEMYRSHASIISRLGAENRTPGAGRNVLMPMLAELGSGSDLIVMSDDDMVWRPDARERLVRFWSDSAHLPHDLLILGGLLEPVYPWNTPRMRLACGDGAVIRDSVPGAAWSMLPEQVKCLPGYTAGLYDPDFGYDYKHCCQLGVMGLRVAAMDLAEHIGWDASTHGNRSNTDVRAKPLDRDKWGV